MNQILGLINGSIMLIGIILVLIGIYFETKKSFAEESNPEQEIKK